MKTIHIAEAIYGKKEIKAVVQALENKWLGAGKVTAKVERRFSRFIGTHYSSLVNSGSSANLLAVRALNFPVGSKVLACAAGFPSTLNPIWHSHLTPVVVDVDLKTLNIDVGRMEEALAKHPDIKAVIFAHSAGLPVDMRKVMRLARAHKLKVIEDNCDALGSKIYDKKTGAWGDISTCSFYASHHITAAGGGGMVSTNSKVYAFRIKEMKEWGKKQITLGFEKDHAIYFDETITVSGEKIPYDHRYSYPQIGYNFKLPEINAAFLDVQLSRLPGFIAKRKKNYAYLRRKMEAFEDLLMYPELSHTSADPSWFIFPITIRDSAGFTRKKIVEYLEARNIRTRLFFAGNILLHKGYRHFPYIRVGSFKNSNKVTKDTFMVGIHPGQTYADLDYIYRAFRTFLKKR